MKIAFALKKTEWTFFKKKIINRNKGMGMSFSQQFLNGSFILICYMFRSFDHFQAGVYKWQKILA
jgi:hypothetical protein